MIPNPRESPSLESLPETPVRGTKLYLTCPRLDSLKREMPCSTAFSLNRYERTTAEQNISETRQTLWEGREGAVSSAGRCGAKSVTWPRSNAPVGWDSTHGKETLGRSEMLKKWQRKVKGAVPSPAMMPTTITKLYCVAQVF